MSQVIHTEALTRFPVKDIIRAGKTAVRFELRPGDQWEGASSYRDGPDQFRTELSGHRNFTATMGKDYWYGFSMLIPADFPHAAVTQVIIGEWHDVADQGEISRSPVLAQRYEYSVFRVQLYYSSQEIQRSDSGIRKVIYDDYHFKKGVWHDFIYHIKWSYESDGFVEMWLDGKKLTDYKGPVGYNDNQGPYFKYGLYIRPKVTERYIVYFDEFRMGNSYEEVDPADNHYEN
jgi:hypothetical protein